MGLQSIMLYKNFKLIEKQVTELSIIVHANVSNTAANVEKVKRQTIFSAGTHGELAYFTSWCIECVLATTFLNRTL